MANLTKVPYRSEMLLPIQLAEKVAQTRESHAWFPDELSPDLDVRASFAGPDVVRIRNLRAELGEDVAYPTLALISPSEMPQLGSIIAAHEDLKSASRIEQEINRGDIPLGGGTIVNMASRAGQRGYAADAMPYGATKAALINLTKSIARSFGADGIVAVAIAPGWVQTGMAEDFVAQFGKQAAVSDIPIGEMAQPSEVAELVAFALRPTQRSLNGATLDLNGGSYIR
jgi:NAD(P)-dependent dehydrogenase (short-subunit alcohol dehydrogenase family)